MLLTNCTYIAGSSIFLICWFSSCCLLGSGLLGLIKAYPLVVSPFTLSRKVNIFTFCQRYSLDKPSISLYIGHHENILLLKTNDFFLRKTSEALSLCFTEFAFDLAIARSSCGKSCSYGSRHDNNWWSTSFFTFLVTNGNKKSILSFWRLLMSHVL